MVSTKHLSYNNLTFISQVTEANADGPWGLSSKDTHQRIYKLRNSTSSVQLANNYYNTIFQVTVQMNKDWYKLSRLALYAKKQV